MKERLEKLRSTLRMNWKELSVEIGISRSLLDFIRDGSVPVTLKALRKIEAAEIRAGLMKDRGEQLSGPLPGREAPADTSPTLGTLDAKLEEILRRLDVLEGNRKNKRGRDGRD